MTRKNSPLEVNVFLICVLLLALGLRLYRIQAQSLWNDEGTSVALAARDLAAITRGAANDIHPPLYYYVLHFWIKLFGKSELAVRSLSALLGTMLVLLTFALGRSMAGNAVGLLASLFAALSPFQVYYSQETRMYVLSAFLGALSMLILLRLLAEGHFLRAEQPLPLRRYLFLAAYAIVTVLLLYSHYFAATLILTQNLVVLWWLFTPRRSQRTSLLGPLLYWGTVQALVVASYLPWLLLAARQLRAWPAISEPLRPAALTLDLLRVFSLGLSVAPQPVSPVLVGFAVLLILGMLAPLVRTRKKVNQEESPASGFIPYITYLLYLFVPVGILYVLSLRRPMYNPKFLLLCILPFDVFLAQGALWLARMISRPWQTTGVASVTADSRAVHLQRWARLFVALAITAFVAGASVYSLRAYYFNPRYARDDYRGIAQYVQAIEREGDAILVNAPGQIETLAYYYHGTLPLYPLPRQRPLDEVQTEADLQQLVQGRGRIFAVLWATDESDPRRFIEGWLDQHAYKATDSWYGNVRLVVYAVPAAPVEGSIAHPLQANLGNKVRLLGYDLRTPEVMPGDILQLTLFWQAIAPMNERYKVFTHIIDAHGHLFGQRDAEPGGGARITTIWKPGEQVVDNYGLLVLPATPPGVYTLEIGMYSLSDGQRLPVVEGEQVIADHIILQPVRILAAAAPPPLSVLNMKKQLNARFGDVTLLGYDLAKLGYEHQPDAPLHPGDILHLTLFWQANRHPQGDLALRLQLQDEKGMVQLEQRGLPTEGQYPTRQWSVNEIVRDQHNLPLPTNLPAGRYRIQLSVQRLPKGQPVEGPITLASLTLK